MEYYLIECVGDLRNIDTKIVVSEIDDSMSAAFKRIKEAKSVVGELPENPSIYIDSDHQGTNIECFISNHCQLLIFDKIRADIIKGICQEEAIETIPINIRDQDQTIISDQHVIINPVNTFDCFNWEMSKVRHRGPPNKEVIAIESVAFHKEKMEAAPNIVRIPEAPWYYFISRKLGKALLESNPTNLFLTRTSQH